MRQVASPRGDAGVMRMLRAGLAMTYLYLSEYDMCKSIIVAKVWAIANIVLREYLLT